MRAVLGLAVLAGLVALSSTTHAQGAGHAKTTAPTPEPNRVHLGSTSVTVVDEHDTVDDVITRLRQARARTPKTEQGTSGSGTQTTTVTADKSGKGHEEGRAELRSQRTVEAEHAQADRPKEERRERAANARGRVDKKQRR